MDAQSGDTSPAAPASGGAEKRPQLSLFTMDESWRQEWKGMPEFFQQDLAPLKTIYVHFETLADMAGFAALVDQPVTMNTRSIWYPEAEIGRFADKRYVDGPPPADAAPDGVDVTELPDE